MRRPRRFSKALSTHQNRQGRPPPADLAEARPDELGLGYRTLGKTGIRRWGRRIDEEFDPRLQGRKAAQKFDEMVRNSPGLGGAIRLITAILSRVELTFEVPEHVPDGRVDAAAALAQFYTEAWEDLKTPRGKLLAEWFTVIKHGFHVSEVIYKVRAGPRRRLPPFDDVYESRYADGRVGWFDFQPRSADSVYEWTWDPSVDEVVGFWQWVEGEAGEHYVPLAKCVHFVLPDDKRSPEGWSMLRSAHRPYHFRTALEEIEAVGIERNLSGLPVMEVPPSILAAQPNTVEAQQLAAYERMVSRVRMDKQEGLVIPAEEYNGQKTGYRLRTLQTQMDPSKADPTIQRHRNDELLALLSEFLALGSGPTGSWALASSQTNTLGQVLGSVVSWVVEAFNAQEVPRLAAMNGFDASILPEMRAGDIEDADLAELGGFLGQAIGAGVITPDTDLEDYIRKAAKLPPIDRTTGGVIPPLSSPADIAAREAAGDRRVG